MEKIKVLRHDWGYPVCQNPRQLYGNIRAAQIQVYNMLGQRERQFVGLGSSGAMLLGAMSFASVPNPGPDEKFILFRKPEDTTNEGKHYQDLHKSNAIIIIDDHITSGSTIWKICVQIAIQGCTQNVVGVIAKSWDNDNPEYVAKHEKLLADYFPSIKFWMY